MDPAIWRLWCRRCISMGWEQFAQKRTLANRQRGQASSSSGPTPTSASKSKSSGASSLRGTTTPLSSIGKPTTRRRCGGAALWSAVVILLLYVIGTQTVSTTRISSSFIELERTLDAVEKKLAGTGATRAARGASSITTSGGSAGGGGGASASMTTTTTQVSAVAAGDSHVPAGVQSIKHHHVTGGDFEV